MGCIHISLLISDIYSHRAGIASDILQDRRDKCAKMYSHAKRSKKHDKRWGCLWLYMTHRIHHNHSLANYQYVKSTAVTLGASRASGTHAPCPGRLIIETVVTD